MFFVVFGKKLIGLCDLLGFFLGLSFLVGILLEPVGMPDVDLLFVGLAQLFPAGPGPDAQDAIVSEVMVAHDYVVCRHIISRASRAASRVGNNALGLRRFC